MHKALKRYLGFNRITNYEGNEVDIRDGDGVDVGDDGDDRVDDVGAVQSSAQAYFDHRNINLDVAEFADGKLVPTGEELARFICDRVQRALGDAATVTEVTVAEDQTLRATFRPDA
jgi:6-pyruvoyl-tetrahydropterin synthase